MKRRLLTFPLDFTFKHVMQKCLLFFCFSNSPINKPKKKIMLVEYGDFYMHLCVFNKFCILPKNPDSPTLSISKNQLQNLLGHLKPYGFSAHENA